MEYVFIFIILILLMLVYAYSDDRIAWCMNCSIKMVMTKHKHHCIYHCRYCTTKVKVS